MTYAIDLIELFENNPATSEDELSLKDKVLNFFDKYCGIEKSSLIIGRLIEKSLSEYANTGQYPVMYPTYFKDMDNPNFNPRQSLIELGGIFLQIKPFNGMILDPLMKGFDPTQAPMEIILGDKGACMLYGIAKFIHEKERGAVGHHVRMQKAIHDCHHNGTIFFRRYLLNDINKIFQRTDISSIVEYFILSVEQIYGNGLNDLQNPPLSAKELFEIIRDSCVYRYRSLSAFKDYSIPMAEEIGLIKFFDKAGDEYRYKYDLDRCAVFVCNLNECHLN